MPSMTRIGRRGLAALLMTAGLGGSLAAQQPATPANQALTGVTVKVDPRTKALIVPLGGTVKWEPDLGGKLIKDVTVQNEAMVLVRNDPTSPRQLILTGQTPGLTRLTILTQDDRRIVYDIVVEPDFEQLRNVIKRTLPTASVDIVPGVGASVILTGFVNKPEDASLVERIATAAVQSQGVAGAGNAAGGPAVAGAGSAQVINAIQIGGNQHVQIDVVVASVNRSEIRARALDFAVTGTQASVGSILSGLIIPQTGGPAQVSPQANLQVGIVPAGFFGALRALRTEGLAKFLTEPKLVTQSGRAANILAGGRQAILSAQSGITGPGVTLEPVGTEVDVLPIVMGNGKIYLEVFPRVRAVNAGRGITVGGALSPGFDEQSARATVMLESGQTFAIGGLIESTVQASANKVPFLGDLPFVGAAFSNVTHEERETELVILVTPRFAEAMDCNQVPKRVPGRETRSPDDYELFLESLLEAPRGQRKVWNGLRYNAAHKCDNAGYPCVGNVCNGPGGACGTHGVAGCSTCGPTGHTAAPMTPMTAPATLPAMGNSTMAAPEMPVEPAPVVPAAMQTQPVIPPAGVPMPLPQEIPVPLPGAPVK
jgi:pilus assembly protein CpaC